jgi:predicted nucleic acid-binding protein
LKILLDTNVILDVWLAREPFWRDSAKLLGQVEKKEIEGVVSPTTITTLYYLATKALSDAKARRLVDSLLEICEMGKVHKSTFQSALANETKDYEDAVLVALAESEDVDYIATRNLKDFRKSKVQAIEPSELVRT